MKMTKETMSALLARPLTTYEDENYSLYLKIARESLDYLLCTNFCSDEDTRTFDAVEGYSTVWTDIFTEIDEVKIGDEVVTNYSVRQFDRRSASWYNSIVFDCPFTCDKEVVITATWGFSSTPANLQALLAGLFAQVSKKAKFDATIKSKKVEDFAVSFDTELDLDDQFRKQYRNTINQYSACHTQGLISGRVKC